MDQPYGTTSKGFDTGSLSGSIRSQDLGRRSSLGGIGYLGLDCVSTTLRNSPTVFTHKVLFILIRLFEFGWVTC